MTRVHSGQVSLLLMIILQDAFTRCWIKLLTRWFLSKRDVYRVAALGVDDVLVIDSFLC